MLFMDWWYTTIWTEYFVSKAQPRFYEIGCYLPGCFLKQFASMGLLVIVSVAYCLMRYFYSAPARFTYHFIKKKLASKVNGIYILIIREFYLCTVLYFILLRFNREGPCELGSYCFIPDNEKQFTLLFDGLRYFFLFFVSSVPGRLAQGELQHLPWNEYCCISMKCLLIRLISIWQSGIYSNG